MAAESYHCSHVTAKKTDPDPLSADSVGYLMGYNNTLMIETTIKRATAATPATPQKLLRCEQPANDAKHIQLFLQQCHWQRTSSARGVADVHLALGPRCAGERGLVAVVQIVQVGAPHEDAQVAV